MRCMTVCTRSLTDARAAKFGVETDEFEDGIVIYGRPLASLKQGASVHCYDDHRVAMAFAVLATVVDGTIIEEKRCVEKTWPNWWDDLENKVRGHTGSRLHCLTHHIDRHSSPRRRHTPRTPSPSCYACPSQSAHAVDDTIGPPCRHARFRQVPHWRARLPCTLPSSSRL